MYSDRQLWLIEVQTVSPSRKILAAFKFCPSITHVPQPRSVSGCVQSDTTHRDQSFMSGYDRNKCAFVVHLVNEKAREQETRAFDDPTQLRTKLFIKFQNVDFQMACTLFLS